MRLKKGFTLAEILVVLMVIGALATLTIPALMKGVNEAQWKTSYKKAYNALVNLSAMERIAGNLPSTSNATGVQKMFESMRTNLSVKDFAKDKGSGAVYKSTDYISEEYSSSGSGSTATRTPNWMITEDNIAYLILAGSANGACGTKKHINAQSTFAGAFSEACVAVIVDVNGLSNGPNVLEPQTTTSLANVETMDGLTGDMLYIFIGKDGAAAGNKTSLITGRIVGDLK